MNEIIAGDLINTKRNTFLVGTLDSMVFILFHSNFNFTVFISTVQLFNSIFTGYVFYFSSQIFYFPFLFFFNNKTSSSKHWNNFELNSKAVAFKLNNIHSTMSLCDEPLILGIAILCSSFVRLGFVFVANIGLDARLYLYNKGHNGVFECMHDLVLMVYVC